MFGEKRISQLLTSLAEKINPVLRHRREIRPVVVGVLAADQIIRRELQPGVDLAQKRHDEAA